MTLPDALAALSSRCVVSTMPATDAAVIVASGGTTLDADVPPLLCATRELAVAEWVRAMDALAPDGSTLRWAETPGMYRFQVTISNADSMTHRVVGDRFAVVCGVQVERV